MCPLLIPELPRLLDVSSVPSYWCDSIAKVELLGPDGAVMRITFCEERTFAGELVRIPNVDVIRPTSSVLSVGEMHALLRQARAVIAEGIRRSGH